MSILKKFAIYKGYSFSIGPKPQGPGKKKEEKEN
jgi:hypothetical protein